MPKESPKQDEILRNALKKAYSARAKLFFAELDRRDVQGQIDKIDKIDGSSLNWSLQDLGISEKAFQKIEASGISPHRIFCHPDIITEHQDLISYYRNLTALSKKGLSQLLSGLKLAKGAIINARAKTINEIISIIIESTKAFTIDKARKVLFSEIGTEIQGSWVNMIGKGAAKNVERILKDFVVSKHLLKDIATSEKEIEGKKKKQTELLLTNDWKIVFSPEPDVGIYDDKNVLRVAIEVKGSMDKAGAQTRYGEAKKSFGKALRENARCETIYLGSCFTTAVQDQIEQNGQVRHRFNLIDIMEDETRRNEFLDEIFIHQIRIIS